jgi:RNA polymerase sigma-70 factor (ECF subfamily)
VGLDVLLETAQSGSGNAARAALSDLVSRLYPSLIGYLVNLTSDRETAKDACQETMVRIVTSISKFAPRPGTGLMASLRAWAFAIATNVCRDLARKSPRTRPLADVGEDLESDRTRQAPATEDEALSGIARDSLMSAVDRLPREQRGVFLLKAYYGYSYREIGRIVGCPEGTAKSRLHHAVLALREEMKRRGTQ